MERMIVATAREVEDDAGRALARAGVRVERDDEGFLTAGSGWSMAYVSGEGGFVRFNGLFVLSDARAAKVDMICNILNGTTAGVKFFRFDDGAEHYLAAETSLEWEQGDPDGRIARAYARFARHVPEALLREGVLEENEV